MESVRGVTEATLSQCIEHLKELINGKIDLVCQNKKTPYKGVVRINFDYLRQAEVSRLSDELNRLLSFIANNFGSRGLKEAADAAECATFDAFLRNS